jgi:hypothetical protein
MSASSAFDAAIRAAFGELAPTPSPVPGTFAPVANAVRVRPAIPANLPQTPADLAAFLGTLAPAERLTWIAANRHFYQLADGVPSIDGNPAGPVGTNPGSEGPRTMSAGDLATYFRTSPEWKNKTPDERAAALAEMEGAARRGQPVVVR